MHGRCFSKFDGAQRKYARVMKTAIKIMKARGESNYQKVTAVLRFKP